MAHEFMFVAPPPDIQNYSTKELSPWLSTFGREGWEIAFVVINQWGQPNIYLRREIKPQAVADDMKAHDLVDARESYFAAGGVESDLGPRDDPKWYWVRAAKLWRDSAEQNTKGET